MTTATVKPSAGSRRLSECEKLDRSCLLTGRESNLLSRAGQAAVGVGGLGVGGGELRWADLPG